MTVVCNASPLISLAKLGYLSLLRDLFGEIRITPEVFDEVVTLGAGRPAATVVQRAGWIRVEGCRDTARLQRWRQRFSLGRGELATILLAQELPAQLAIIDERRARQLAIVAGVKVVGCVGILELGHRKGLVSDLRSVYQQMAGHGIRIDPQILNRSLASVNLPTL